MSLSVRFYYDYASPWAYLADALLERRLPGIAIDHCPIYLRGLETFAKGVPYPQSKLRYMLGDLHRCAAHEGVALRFPTEFPINGMHALRGALHALAHGGFVAYHRAMFRATWAEDRNVSSKEVVMAVAAEAGQEPVAFARALDDPPVKAQLRQATADADARGVFGVPTFAVGEALFWGHDRMDYVARAIGV